MAIQRFPHVAPPYGEIHVLRIHAVCPEVIPVFCRQKYGDRHRAMLFRQGVRFPGTHKIAFLRFAFQISLHAELLIRCLHRGAADAEILTEPANGRHSLPVLKLSRFHCSFQRTIQLQIEGTFPTA